MNAPVRVASLTAISASQDADGMQPGIVAMNEDPGMAPPPEVAELLPSEDDFAMMQQGYAENPDGPTAMNTAMAKLGALMTGVAAGQTRNSPGSRHRCS